MSDSIHTLLQALPETSLTTRVLGVLDYLAPGEWQNVTSFEKMVESVTGETDPEVVQAVGVKALQLWFDESTGYQRAATIFKLVDSESTMAGAASLASLAGQRFELLSFLKDITPKPDTVQAIDAGVKLAAELAAFCSMNGLPGDSVGDFVSSLLNASKEDAMRFSAWIALDVVLPLGPDGVSKVISAVQGITEGELANNRVFRTIASYLPGDIGNKKQLVTSTLDGAKSAIDAKIQNNAISQDGILAKVREYVDVADDKLDLVAAALDVSNNYYEHTGIQTVARRLVTRAYGEI
ncbi:MAG: hypothetical protein KIT84_38700 [Labilithrix sp.]|nr:hypothetical protein [Labilithrix sp.]MCW5816991.1 hypothetical protein [Labilithrix sp.]